MKQLYAVMFLIIITIMPVKAEINLSNYKLDPYGFIAAEGVYDNHGINVNEGYVFVTSNSKDSGDFNINARATRLGINVTDNKRFNAKLECDFAGTTNNNEIHPRLRHSYFTVQLGRSELLFGQTWVPTAPAFSSLLETRVTGFPGILWARSPQLRLSTKPMNNLLLAFSVIRPTRYPDFNNGTSSEKPAFNIYIQAGIKKAVLTLSGLLGKWINNNRQSAEVNFLAAGIKVPISIVTLSGQYWYGKNLDDYFGGAGNMGYGINEVRAKGGFGKIKIQPHRRLWFEGGLGIDNPEDERLAAGSVSKNQAHFGNINVLFFDSFSTTLEFEENKTTYLTAPPAIKDVRKNHRYSLTTRFEF